MAYRDICRKIKYPSKTSERYKRLDGLDRLRNGTLYEHLSVPFDVEDLNGTYIRLHERRPNVVWQGARMLVDQLSGLLWGDEQMPIVRTYEGDDPSEQDRESEKSTQHISESLNLDAVMDQVTDAASSGSAAVILRAMDDKSCYIEVVPGKECVPKFDPRNPNVLISLDQCYPTTGQALYEMGYDIEEEDRSKDYWFRLTIDDTMETRYQPLPADKYERLGSKDLGGVEIRWEVDEDHTFEHGWPGVPVQWAKAPSRSCGKIDGDPLYGNIVDILVGIDYDLSQVQRGFRYSADPMLAIRRGELHRGSVPAGDQGPLTTRKDERGNIVKSPSNIMDIEPGGEAKLLEISGQGLDKMREFIKLLREWGLEISGGMKSDAETTRGVESGRALEMLYQSLILVVKRWRVALGNMVYLPLLGKLMDALDAGIINIPGVDGPTRAATMRLVWPTWMTPSGSDLLASANAWQVLAGGSAKDPVPILPRTTVTRIAAGNLGMSNTSSVLEELEEQINEDEQRAQQDAQTQHAQALEMQQAKAPGSSPEA